MQLSYTEEQNFIKVDYSEKPLFFRCQKANSQPCSYPGAASATELYRTAIAVP
tara:strand:- start:1215 stop:1373 length:159 start_codon:yes stop_codon:yes gene_type:complete